MFNSKEYWENRYKNGGNSGSGSYGILSEYKANIINNFIIKNNIKSVVEFGCGDGNQLEKIKCDKYTGYDVSETIVDICKKKFEDDKNKSFYLYNNYYNEKYDLSLSLDVIYHLIEDDIFEDYMFKLFNSSNEFIIIYSSDGDIILDNISSHIFDRNFTKWIEKNIKNFNLIEKINNKYKYNDMRDNLNSSISNFFIYKNTK